VHVSAPTARANPPPGPPTFPQPAPCRGPCADNKPTTSPIESAPTGLADDAAFLRRADGTEVYFYRTNFVQPGELIQAVVALVNIPDLVLKDLPRSNQVAMQGTRDAIETGLSVFAYFDVADPQVFVEAKIVELTYDSNF
jgi:hypothetical protein